MPALRKLALTVHVVSSVGWLGAILAFMGMAIAGLTSDDGELVRALYLAAEPVTWFVLVPLALASLLTGVVQSLITTWGLIQHYWVLFKLVITVFAAGVLLLYTQTVGFLADVAATQGADAAQLQGPTFVLHSSAALVLLLGATVLAVYKPRGRTRYGQRKQRELREASQGEPAR
jgi:hypothetical protein